MKRLFSFALLLTFSTVLLLGKDVTTFLGIPVDGTKAAMIQKLKAKGFRQKTANSNILVGEFNGRDVEIHVVTNNNKVYRIMVRDRHGSNEADIINRFNILCHQFENNKKYISFSTNEYEIKEDEDISYNMTVNNKRYEAVFFQNIDSTKIDKQKMGNEILQKIYSQYPETYLDSISPEKREEILTPLLIELGTDLIIKKSVWFTISNLGSLYYIVMYYDNKYNEANGEDL